MSIPYPTKPWSNGQTFTYQLPNGSDVTATFESTKNAWTFTTTTNVSVQSLSGPTVADPTPQVNGVDNYLILVVDKSDGTIKAITP